MESNPARKKFNTPTRRECLVLLPAALVLGSQGVLNRTATGASPGSAQPGSPVEHPDPSLATLPLQDPALVQEMVTVSHARKDRVMELLKIAPQLAKAAIDWGFGDWESALGAASHTGNRAIAEALLEHGARPDIFTFAMLGRLGAVKAMIEAQPGIQRTHGPHGITLLAHAKAGGPEAAPVAEYLAALGDAGDPLKGEQLTDDVKAGVVGSYSFGSAPTERFEVSEKNGAIWISREGKSARGMTYMGEHAFAPAGAPDVRVRFEFENNKATRLRITAPGPVVEAVRRQ